MVSGNRNSWRRPSATNALVPLRSTVNERRQAVEINVNPPSAGGNANYAPIRPRMKAASITMIIWAKLVHISEGNTGSVVVVFSSLPSPLLGPKLNKTLEGWVG